MYGLIKLVVFDKRLINCHDNQSFSDNLFDQIKKKKTKNKGILIIY